MKRSLLVSAALLALVGLAWWLGRPERSTRPADEVRISNHRPPEVGAHSPAHEGNPSSADSRMTAGKDEINRLLSQTLAAMRQRDQPEIDRLLASLDRMLGGDGNNTAAAIAAILEFLRSGQDAPTGHGFVITEGGVLSESTTLRVYLMDKLGLLSREAGGGAALEVAHEILQQFGSADEWAVSMRNVAWFDSASSGFLQKRVDAMLNHPAWRDRPTTGMLEAFDIIVHSGALVTVPELGKLVSTPDTPLARASGVALDRLASQHALELTSLLNQQPELLSNAPQQRAGLFAHADLGVPEQRQQLENYLLRPDVIASERKKFFSSLVQSGRFVSHNLVTPFVPPETPAQAGARLETLTRTVNEWMRDPRFTTLHGELATLGNTVNRIIDEIEADKVK
ncbi:MAG: hypothetical protein V4689_21815 [Verrucomicrobiota bacterium]